MNKFTLVSIVIILCSISNLITTYKQTKELLFEQTTHSIKPSKIISYIFKANDITVSMIGLRFFFSTFLPTFIFSLLFIVVIIKSIFTSLNNTEFSLNYSAHIFATITILWSRISYSLVNKAYQKNSELTKNDEAIKSSTLSTLVNVSIRTYIFASLCFTPILFFRFTALSFVVCILSAFLIVRTEIIFLIPKRIAGVVFIQVCIIIVGWFLAFLTTL